MATSHPVASVFNFDNPAEKQKSGVKLGNVFSAPLRCDIVKTVHRDMAKNKRQAMGVKYEAGYDTAAISWGTGRAVARIPRVPGGGTHRSGQGAFGNMCRGGGMFNPNKVWRKWHRKVNVGSKRHATAAAIAASGVAPLVMARGHKIDEIPELPLVVSNGAEGITKTKDAFALLNGLGCGDELQKCKDTKNIRSGRGKIRNRRYIMRKGPLVIYNKDEGISRSFRNIPGVDLCSVERLNLLQLAPGGHFGRFCIYTEGAVNRLSELFGSYKAGGGSDAKKGYTLPRSPMTNTDIAKIINSNEVQSVLRPAKEAAIKNGGVRAKKNMMTNKSQRGKMCPGLNKRIAIRAAAHDKNSKVAKSQEKRNAKKVAAKKAHMKEKKVYFKSLMAAHAPAVAETEAADEE